LDATFQFSTDFCIICNYLQNNISRLWMSKMSKWAHSWDSQASNPKIPPHPIRRHTIILSHDILRCKITNPDCGAAKLISQSKISLLKSRIYERLIQFHPKKQFQWKHKIKIHNARSQTTENHVGWNHRTTFSHRGWVHAEGISNINKRDQELPTDIFT